MSCTDTTRVNCKPHVMKCSSLPTSHLDKTEHLIAVFAHREDFNISALIRSNILIVGNLKNP